MHKPNFFINVILNAILIPLFGLEGAATASAVSLALWKSLMHWSIKQRIGINSMAFSFGRN